MVLHVELEREAATGRWIADVVNVPGVLVYGAMRLEAFRKAQALALGVIADRIARGEDPETGKQTRPRPLASIEFETASEAAMARSQGRARLRSAAPGRLEGEAPDSPQGRLPRHPRTSRFPDYVFAFYAGEELHPPMLARLGKKTGLKPSDL